MLSCTGSMRLAPLGGEQPVLFDTDAQAAAPTAAQLGSFG